MSKTNWAGNVKFEPVIDVIAETEEQVEQCIQRAIQENLSLRVIGSGHSFYPLAATRGISLSIDGLDGIVAVDPGRSEGWVWAGTKIKSLGEKLHSMGYAMENLGDIDVQSIAGAVSTGTHGTGIRFGSISTQVVGVELWNGLGKKVEIHSKKNPELLDAVRVSLGTLGVITKLQLKLQPKYVLEMKQTKESLSKLLSQLPQEIQHERNFEFFWFPHTDTALVKRSHLSTEEPLKPTLGQKFNDIVLENMALGALSGICRWVPPLTPSVSQLCAVAAGESYRRDWSHRVFATERWVKFVEMEYSVPLESFAEVIREIQSEIKTSGHRVHFPIECRIVKGDSIWLSPAHGRDSALIAVHMYRGMPYRTYFDAMEKIFRKYGGRPHWGKLHTLNASDFQSIYPKWNEFQKLRKEMDPNSIFMTPELSQIFGESPQAVLSSRSA